MRRLISAIALVGLGLGAALHPAQAHDVHTFRPYSLALGWLREPAYVGADNAVQVLVKNAKGDAVTDLTDKDLNVDVFIGDATMSGKKLTPAADPDTGLGTPGELRYAFIPTVPGAYTFQVRGSIHGVAVDDRVTASDKTFDLVREPASAEFPVAVPGNADLGRKLDAVSARQSDAAAAASDARSAANRALGVGVAALVLALVAGSAGLLVGRRAAPRG